MWRRLRVVRWVVIGFRVGFRAVQVPRVGHLPFVVLCVILPGFVVLVLLGVGGLVLPGAGSLLGGVVPRAGSFVFSGSSRQSAPW